MNILNSIIKLYYDDTQYIEINGNVSISNSCYELTSTASIDTSKSETYVFQEGFRIGENEFTMGNKVEIWLCYGIDDNLVNIFNGYISNYSSLPTSLRIDVEDEMYLLKHMPRVKNSWKESDNLTLSGLMDWLLPSVDFDIEVMDMTIGSFVIKNKLLPSEILKMLKDMFHIYIYFRDGKLYVGHQYWDLYEEGYTETYKFAHPVKDEFNYIIENNLTYLIVDVNSYRVKGSSIYENTKLVYDYPENIEDPDNIITLNLNGLNLDSLKVIVKEKYDNLEKGGLLGDFTTFGIPIINQGDIVDLDYNFSYIKDEVHELRESYYVDTVETTFGDDGYKQKITIGNKII